MNTILVFLKKHYILLILLVLFFLFRVPVLNEDVFSDEGYYYKFAINDHKTNLKENLYNNYAVLYFPSLFYKLSYFVLGANMWAFRLIPLILTFFAMLLIFFLVKEYYDKNAAYFFLFFAALNPWFVFSSTRLDYDGCLLNFFFALTLYFFFKYLISKRSLFLYLIGVCLGFSIWTKSISGFLLFITIALFLIYMNYKKLFSKDKITFLKRNVAELSKIIFPIILVLIIFVVIYLFILGKAHTLELLLHYLGQGTGNFGFNILFILQLLLPILLISPLVIGLLFAYIFTKWDRRLDYFILYIVIFALFFVLITISHNFRPLERYASIIILPLLVVCSVFASKYFKFKKILLKILILSSFFTIVSILPISFILERNILNFYPKTALLHNIINLNWNFLMPFNASAGPIGFYVNFLQLIIPTVLSFALIIAIIFFFRYYSIPKLKAIKICLLFFISISLVYSFVILFEYNFTIQNYDLPRINNELLGFASSLGPEDTIYSFRNNFGFNVQLGRSDILPIGFQDEFDNDRIEEVLQEGNYILIQDFPQINKESDLWNALKGRCDLIGTFKSSGKELGYAYKC